MESPTWPEILPSNRIKMIQALTRGEEWTNKLRELLRSGEIDPNSSISIDDVVVQVMRMFENTLSIMGSNCNLINEPPRLPTNDLHSSCYSDVRKSEISDEISPRSITPVKMKRGCYTRRKNSWTSTKVTTELVDDGHAWRKYGQKEIHNKKYQRSYYRCTFKYDQGCQASKQVQTSHDNPPNYSITYFGHHTCNNYHRSPPIILDSQDPIDHTSTIWNFEINGVIDHKNVKKRVEPNYIPTQLNYEHLEEGATLNSVNAYQSWDDLSTQIPLESVSMLPSKFDHAHMVYSGLDQGDMTLVSGASCPINYEMNPVFWNE
ncbi:probable WRKY transcription factor 70 [Rutidosis leptorrhynchoides]|uniref:probable WRKY transcription factor 70 n=1 Tax=Rutidosis leptorrhynchoides TaxID=125765 RepID=UPI003A99A679